MAIRKIRTKRGVEKYQINIRDADGVQVKREFQTLAAAKQKHSEIQMAKARGTYIAPSRLPLFQEVAERWFKSKSAHRPSSRAQWHAHLGHLEPLNGLRLDRIDVARVERLRDDLARRKTHSLGPRTVNKILTTGAAIFELAQRHGLVERNPFRLAERLRVGSGELVGDERVARSSDGRVRPEDVPTIQEVRKLLAATEGDLYSALFLTQAVTGARTGEIFALQWADLDWANEKIAIRRSVSWARVRSDGEPVRHRFFGPKTASGVRDLPFPKELQRVLRVWKIRCSPNDHDLIFPAEGGAPLHRSNVLRYGLYPACRRAGVRAFNMKSLRHFFASSLIMRGEPITRVAELMGHSSPLVTLKVYAHWLRNSPTNGVADLARALCEEGDVNDQPELTGSDREAEGK